MRAHAWAILSSLTQGGLHSTPDWETTDWQGKCAVGLGNTNCQPNKLAKGTPILSIMETPVELKSIVTSDQAKAFQVSSVLYNHAAVQFIKSQHLAEGGHWKRLLHEHRAASGEAAPRFNRGALVVKEIFEAVSTCDSMVPNCRSKLYVWNPQKVTSQAIAPDIQFPQVVNWTQSVLDVNLDPTSPCAKSRVYPIVSANDHAALPDQIPLSCFHYIPVSPGATSPLKVGAGIVANSPGWVPKSNAYLVLVGFQIASAEAPDWVWSTFWWTNDPRSDIRAQDQPASIAASGPWSFFSMDTTMSADLPLEATDHGPKIIYNPYLEGSVNNGPVSNCLYCHQRAVIRKGEQHVESDIASGSPRRCALVSPQTLGCAGLPSYGDSYRDAIRTNFLWSIAIHQDLVARRDFENIK